MTCVQHLQLFLKGPSCALFYIIIIIVIIIQLLEILVIIYQKHTKLTRNSAFILQ